MSAARRVLTMSSKVTLRTLAEVICSVYNALGTMKTSIMCTGGDFAVLAQIPFFTLAIVGWAFYLTHGAMKTFIMRTRSILALVAAISFATFT